MHDSDAVGLTIDELRATLALEGLEVSRAQFRRWYQVGLLEPPIAPRKGLGTGAGWAAARYPIAVKDRLLVIAQIFRLDSGAGRRPRVPIPYLAWALYRRGYTVPDDLVVTAVKRVAAMHERVVAKARQETGSLSHLVDHSSRHLKSPVLRGVRHIVNASGSDYSNRFGAVMRVIFNVLRGTFVTFTDRMQRTAFRRFRDVPDWEPVLHKFSEAYRNTPPQRIADRITPSQFALLFPALDDIPRLFAERAGAWPQLKAFEGALPPFDPETEIGFVLALIPIIPLLLEVANVQSTPAT